MIASLKRYSGTSWMVMMIFVFSCKEPYTPRVVDKGNGGFLVVDGILQGVSDSTIITLTRSRNINDTAPGPPELNAQLTVEGQNADLFPLQELGNGKYGIAQLNLREGSQYRLRINTNQGKHYLSDFVPFKPTPPIDSVSWQRDTTGISVYVNTHDESSQTRFYRWEYAETWQYHTYANSELDLIDGSVTIRGPNERIYNCWRGQNSTDIKTATSGKLSADIIYQFKLLSVPTGSEKLSLTYSVLVKQYALTPEAYDYWQGVKKNTEELGGLFDAQPTSITGNVHCLEDPKEPVLGYISASTVQEKRIFVSEKNIENWYYVPYYLPCEINRDVVLGLSPTDNERINDYLLSPSHLYTFWYVDRGIYIIIQNFCADCREHGGTNIKPDYWP